MSGFQNEFGVHRRFPIRRMCSENEYGAVGKLSEQAGVWRSFHGERIDQELDRQRILNVAVAEDATIPLLPEPSLMPVKLGFAALLAALLSLGVGIGADHYDRTFRTPIEVATCLEVAVLGSIPLIGSENSTPGAAS